MLMGQKVLQWHRMPKADCCRRLGRNIGQITTLNRFDVLLSDIAAVTTFLRTGSFIETWGEGAVVSDAVRAFLLALDQAIPMVSTIDLGTAAADHLRAGRAGQESTTTAPRPDL